MSHETAALLVFGGLAALAVVMLAIERRGIARRKAARGGRDVDVSALIFGPTAGSGKD